MSLAPAAARTAPGPREWPLVGSVSALRTRDMVGMFAEQWRTYGDVSRLNLFGRRMTLIAHPDHLATVLMSETYVKGATYDPIRRLLGDSLVTLEGDAWRTRRRLASPSFRPRSLQELTGIMAGTGSAFLDGVLRTAGGGIECDLSRLMSELTLNVAIDTLFGRELIDVSRDVSFDALARSLELASKDGQGVPLPAWVPTPDNRRFVRTIRELDGVIHRIIEAGRDRGPSGTLLSQLLEVRDDNGDPLPEKALRDEVFTLFMAGHETTALALTWALALMSEHPDVLRRLQEEVDTVLDGREPTFADVARLTYTRQVLDETLRIRPPAPAVARDATADDEIGGYRVEAGSSVLVMLWITHHHPGFWPDPERFDPDRFAPGAAADRHPWAYAPFSRGPRVCIGNAFSLVESALLLAQLLARFRVEVRPGSDLHPRTVFTVRPAEPVRVRLTPR